MNVQRYHKSPNSEWRQSKNLEGNFVGIEFEVHNLKGMEETANHLDLTVKEYQGKKVLVELDASLDVNYGCEVVTPPIALKDALRKDGFLAKLVDNLLAAGCVVKPDNRYGMHLNINCKGWDQQAVDLFTLSVYLLKPLCEKLGGRKSEVRFANNVDNYWKPRVELGANKFRLITNGKYNPIWQRAENNTVVEARYPLAILDFEGIKKNISLLYSIRAFSETNVARWLVMFYANTLKSPLENYDYNYPQVVITDKAWDLFTNVYISWLSQQKNFKKLFANLEMKPNEEKYTIQSIEGYARQTVTAPAPIQEQAIKRSNAFAKAGTEFESAKKPVARPRRAAAAEV